MSIWAVLGAALAAVATIAAAIIAARQAHRTVVTAPYDQLSTRVTTLERQVDMMRRVQWRTDNDLDAAVDALWEQQRWIEDGAIPPPPTIARRALEVVHRRRAERAETYDPADDGQPTDPTDT